jgi:hypothetical protein
MKTRLLRKCRKGIRIVLVHSSYQMDVFNQQTGRWEYRSGGLRHNVLRDFHSAMKWTNVYKKAVAYKRIDNYYEQERTLVHVC